MKRLPIDVSSFRIMIEDNYTYIDKTHDIYNLITQGRFYFLSRPRRFGKSLLVSTLKELFLGNKKLFEGLWITKNTDYNWPEHPVIDLNLSGIPQDTVQHLRHALCAQLASIAKRYNVDLPESTPEEMLGNLITELSKRNRVVILIDEYDSTILKNIHDLELARAQRDALRSFFEVIKNKDEHLKFVLLTGVTRFAHTSIFSGLNNLNDISMKPQAASLLGYTDDEIDNNFGDYINAFANTINTPIEDIRQKMRDWYNGYRFSIAQIKVYNPFSVLYCLLDKRFANYWVKSATPHFLITLIGKNPAQLPNIETIKLSESSLETINIEKMHLIPILFQTGYYTIRDYDEQYNQYLIGYPNREVQEAFTGKDCPSTSFTTFIHAQEDRTGGALHEKKIIFSDCPERESTASRWSRRVSYTAKKLDLSNR